MRKLLLPFSLLYWIGVTSRNWFFDKGILKTTKVSVPVISVGNISTGGVGKTPIIEMLIERIKNNRQLSVVSRGYGRKSAGNVIVSDGRNKFASIEDSGDESSQISRKYTDVIVVVDEQRVRGAKKAVELGANMILLDDGFQHRYLYRDLNIVVMTAEEILKGDLLLPAGCRREPLSSLKRSDLVIVSRCVDRSECDRATAIIGSFNKPVVGVKTKLKSFKHASLNKIMEFGDLAGKNIIAFSGIGNPRSFETILTQSGAIVKKHLVFSDHHWYTKHDIETIFTVWKRTDSDYIITTEKDAIRLNEGFVRFLETAPVYVAEIQQEILVGEETLDDILQRVIN